MQNQPEKCVVIVSFHQSLDNLSGRWRTDIGFDDFNTFVLYLFFNQNAVSMYCRLGFAVKKGQVISSEQLHPTWKNAPSVNRLKYVRIVGATIN